MRPSAIPSILTPYPGGGGRLGHSVLSDTIKEWMDHSNPNQFRSFMNLPNHVATLSLDLPSLTAFFTASSNRA
jgi:hypothetical protein